MTFDINCAFFMRRTEIRKLSEVEAAGFRAGTGSGLGSKALIDFKLGIKEPAGLN